MNITSYHNNNNISCIRLNQRMDRPPLIKLATESLLDTYSKLNPSFNYTSTHNPRRILTKPSKPCHNQGFDNEDYDYLLYVNDILGNQEGRKYQIIDIVGQGTFGQVVKCVNTKTKEIVAVKVIKNKPPYYNQSLVEVTILEFLNTKWDPQDKHHIARIKDTFVFRNHLCIVFEMLNVNLYELIKQNGFRGLSMRLVRIFIKQILDALIILNKARIIHCDLKPENILLSNLETPSIKLIDFGSACYESQTVYTYIQSRFYRSPEVLLGLPYTSTIDMWSVGCIAAELFLGLPLFPGTSEFNQVTRIVEMLGIPPQYMLDKGKSVKKFFDKTDNISSDNSGKTSYNIKTLDKYLQENSHLHGKEEPSRKYLNGTTLEEIIQQYPLSRKSSQNKEFANQEYKMRECFIDFLKGLLNQNPFYRWSPQQAIQHPFLTEQEFIKPFVPPGSGSFPFNNQHYQQQHQQPQQDSYYNNNNNNMDIDNTDNNIKLTRGRANTISGAGMAGYSSNINNSNNNINNIPIYENTNNNNTNNNNNNYNNYNNHYQQQQQQQQQNNNQQQYY